MENKENCKVCNKPVIVSESGVIVHEGGGSYEQSCKSCNWKGGQYGGFSACPRCGSVESLFNDHKAS